MFFVWVSYPPSLPLLRVWQSTSPFSWRVCSTTCCLNHDLCNRDERTVIFCNSDPALIFKNSVQVQLQSKIFFKWNVLVQMKFKIFEKCTYFTTKRPHIFSINSVQIRSGSKFWSDLQPGSNPNSTKFAMDRIQVQSNAHLCCATLPKACFNWILDSRPRILGIVLCYAFSLSMCIPSVDMRTVPFSTVVSLFQQNVSVYWTIYLVMLFCQGAIKLHMKAPDFISETFSTCTINYNQCVFHALTKMFVLCEIVPLFWPKNVFSKQCLNLANTLMMVTAVTETSPKCRLYHFLWPLFSL